MTNLANVMDGLSDENSYSDVELKELSSVIGLNPDDNLIQPDDVTEVETRGPATAKRKKVGLKTMGKAITAFLGVPEERNPASYDPTRPVVSYFVTPIARYSYFLPFHSRNFQVN